MRSRYQQADKMVFKPAFVMLNISDGQSSPPFQTPITVSGRTWGVGERQRERDRGRETEGEEEEDGGKMEEEEEEKGKDVRGEDMERRRE